MTSNANLFRRYFRAEDAMLRASMPTLAAAEDAAIASNPVVRSVVASRNGLRLVKVVPVLTASVAERMVVNG